MTAGIERWLAAPPPCVFAMWTDQRLADWWRPPGTDRCRKSPIWHALDVRPGGAFDATWRDQDASEFRWHGTYETVAPHRRLVYHEHCQHGGQPFHAARVVLEFADQHGGTLLTMQAQFMQVAARDARWTREVVVHGWRTGWTDHLQQLAESLQSPCHALLTA